MPTTNFKVRKNNDAGFNMYLEYKEKLIKRKIENKNIFIKKVR